MYGFLNVTIDTLINLSIDTKPLYVHKRNGLFSDSSILLNFVCFGIESNIIWSGQIKIKI